MGEACLLIVCGTLVALALIAAVTVTLNGLAALAKVDPEKVPELIIAMRALLVAFKVFMPRGHGIDRSPAGRYGRTEGDATEEEGDA